MLGRKKLMRIGAVSALVLAVAAPVVAQQTATPPAVPQTVVVLPGEAAPLPQLTPAQASQLVSLLAEARYAHGLVHDAKPAEAPGTNDALVRQALDYAKAVHAGRLDTGDFQSDWALRPAAYDPSAGFADAVAKNRIAQWMNALPPPYAGYDYLKSGLDTYRRIEASGGWGTLAAGPDLALGATGPRVAALRKRIAMEDSTLDAAGDKYDEALKAAVVRAQNRYGLNPTGAVSTQTHAALNVPVGDRVRSIMANMERWRWMPQEMPKNRIQVNIASAQLAVFEGDKAIASMRAVTGAPGGRETPMLWSRMHSVVLNPPWNVPAGIAAKELFPKGAAYLASQGFKIIGEGANRRLQQQPGKSALGRYKFDFDNPFAVYLHDTPSQSTFSRYDRLASHGCVRLEKPAALARLLLKGDPEWTPEKIDATIATVKTTRVPLKVQPDVFLLYWSAFGSANGAVSFRADPYGWDKVLAAKIEKRSAAKAAQGR